MVVPLKKTDCYNITPKQQFVVGHSDCKAKYLVWFKALKHITEACEPNSKVWVSERTGILLEPKVLFTPCIAMHSALGYIIPLRKNTYSCKAYSRTHCHLNEM